MWNPLPKPLPPYTVSFMTNRPSVAAIIPAYNEELTVADVVRVAALSPLVDEVIVVSDGSTDKTVARAEQAGAITLAFPENQGKGSAMTSGVVATQAPVVLFLDADLRGLTADHIERLLLPVLSGARAMNVGLRDRGFLVGLMRHLPLIGGERAMKREVFERVHRRFLGRFMVESVLNYSCRSRGEDYGSVVLPGLSIRRKYQKVGMRRALGEYIKMGFQVAYGMALVRLARLVGKF